MWSRKQLSCSALCFSLLTTTLPTQVSATAAEAYNPSWTSELRWATEATLMNRPLGSQAWVEDNYAPWWVTRVAHPIQDYDAAKLPTGVARLDSALDVEYTIHRTKPGWTYAKSPTEINNVYTYTPGSNNRNDRTAKSGQNLFLDLGLHPIQSVSADIGAEIIGNYDERFWFPVNDENRMYKDNKRGRVVRAQVKYDTEAVMIRGFQGTQLFDWTAKNDLFALLPQQLDVEFYRRAAGTITPRGGEGRFKTPFGTLDVIGGTEIRWGFGPSVFARYDLPTFKNLETSIVYRNESVPFSKVIPNSPDEQRWTTSLNASYPFSERITGHAGILYQPFRIDRPYQDFNSLTDIPTRKTKRADAFGFTARTEVAPPKILDRAGIGFTHLGPIAGNKQQVDLDASKTFLTNWTLSGAYIYRQPVVGPVPLVFQGTTSNPGALLASPRGPDDPFWVQWDNRKAHLLSTTLAFDPTPATPWFTYRPNVLEDWNLSREEDAEWIGIVQYRLAHYRSNLDRLYYYNEDRSLNYDPIFHTGARGSDHPLSSATGLVQWRRDRWHVTADLSGGEALAGAGIAYTPATNFYKPSTIYMQGGLSVDNSVVKLFGRYGRDVWGPADYHTQLGWTYSHVYQAGLSYIFLRDFQAGFRYVGTRMDKDFIGSDTGAFNEYNFFLTYHFGVQHDFGPKLAAIGRPLPQSFPEASVTLSDPSFTPDGSGPTRVILISPRASADAGILSYGLFVRNAQGEVVRKWEGSGTPTSSVRWEGLGPDAKPLPTGAYRVTLTVVDLYGNEATSPAQTVQLQGTAVVAEAPNAAPAGKTYTVTSTPEGLKVTLSSLILFDIDQSSLKEVAKDALDQVVGLLKAYPNNVLRVSGFTDASGSIAHNQKLSEERAQSVADYLSVRGSIDRSRLTVVGYGKKRPIASNSTEEGRQQNRRVEIDILK